jgi:hypothetical protein
MENVKKSAEAAQAIIVAAFLIGIGILVLSSLLNGLIFSQDLASRDSGAEERTVIEFVQDAEEAVGMAMTGNRTTPADAEDEFEDYINLYETELIERYTSRQRAVSLGPTGSDSYLNLSDISSTRAWALGQRCDINDATTDCSFQNESYNSANWQVVDEDDAFAGDSPYKLEFTVEQPSSGEFVVNVTDDTSTFLGIPIGADENWKMNVTNSEIAFKHEVFGVSLDSDSYDWSDIDGSRARIEVMNGTINGKDTIGGDSVDTKSSELDDDLEQMFFEQGDAVQGTYDIRLSDSVDSGDITGPCDSTPDVCELIENGDDRDLYNVGVVHEVNGIEASYVDGDISHTSEIDETLEQEDMILEDR